MGSELKNGLGYTLAYSVLRGNDFAGHVRFVKTFLLNFALWPLMVVLLALNHHYKYTDSFVWFLSILLWTLVLLSTSSKGVNDALAKVIGLDASISTWKLCCFILHTTMYALWIGAALMMKSLEHSHWAVICFVPGVVMILVMMASGFIWSFGYQVRSEMLRQKPTTNINKTIIRNEKSLIVVIGGGFLLLMAIGVVIILIAALLKTNGMI